MSINCFVISLSNAFSKFPVIKHIPCLTYAIFSETNLRNKDSDFGGINSGHYYSYCKNEINTVPYLVN